MCGKPLREVVPVKGAFKYGHAAPALSAQNNLELHIEQIRPSTLVTAVPPNPDSSAVFQLFRFS